MYIWVYDGTVKRYINRISSAPQMKINRDPKYKNYLHINLWGCKKEVCTKYNSAVRSLWNRLCDESSSLEDVNYNTGGDRVKTLAHFKFVLYGGRERRSSRKHGRSSCNKMWRKHECPKDLETVHLSHEFLGFMNFLIISTMN